MKTGCAAAAPEVGKEMRPSTGAWSAATGTVAVKSANHKGTQKDSAQKKRPQNRWSTREVYPAFQRPAARLGLSVLCLPLRPCRCSAISEAEPHHELHDPHEPRLNRRLAEAVAGRERSVALQRANSRTVEEV